MLLQTFVQRYTRVLAILGIACFSFVYGVPARAAALTNLSDILSTMQVSGAADHVIRFTTPTGVHASAKTIILSLPAFTLGSVDVSDIDVTHGPTTGAETSETLAASAASGVWGVAISGTTITLTSPTNAASGEIAVNDKVIITIGTAAGGTHQITNPSSEGNYTIAIAGTFGDTGSMVVHVTDMGVQNVTATVPSSGGGGGGGGSGGGSGDTTAPTISNVAVTSSSPTTALVTWVTDESATSIVNYGHTIAYASGTVTIPGLVISHSVPLSGLVPCATYHVRVTSADQMSNSASSADVAFTMPCDTTPLVISGVQITNITDTTALVSWTTNKPSSSVVDYGITNAYGSQNTIPGNVVLHSVPLTGLASSTTYHVRARSVDLSLFQDQSGNVTFTTTGDTTPPANVVLTAVPEDGRIRLSWIPPSDADFAGTIVVRTVGSSPTGPTDGTLIYNGSGTAITDTNVTNGVTYIYAAYAYDANGNVASGALASAAPRGTTPILTMTLAATPGDGRVMLAWVLPNDPLVVKTRIMRTTGSAPQNPTEGDLVYLGPGANAVDTNVTNGTEYFYTAFALDASDQVLVSASARAVPSGPIISRFMTLFATPGDGRVDLRWTTPSSPDVTAIHLVRREGVYPTGPLDGTALFVGNGTTFTDTDVTNGTTYYYGVYGVNAQGMALANAIAAATPQGLIKTVTTTTRALVQPSVILLGANGTLPLSIGTGGTIGVLTGSSVLVRVSESSIDGVPRTMTVSLHDATYALTLNPATRAYEGIITMPAPGTYSALVAVTLTDDRTGAAILPLLVRPAGRVVSQALFSASVAYLSGARVTLYDDSAGDSHIWNGALYGQANPITTDVQGVYAFQVPPGAYHMELEADGYVRVKTATQYTDANVIGDTISLVQIPTPIVEVLRSTSTTPQEKVVVLAQSVTDRVLFGVKTVQQLLVTPAVQEATTKVAAPTILTVTVLNTASALPLFNIFAYLQYFFTQPLLLFGRRKRKQWGVVYNAITKQPIDLAVIRLLHADTGLIVQTRVSDRQGRYQLHAHPGRYRIEVVKVGFAFPTEYVRGKSTDVQFTDVYHAEVIQVNEEATLTPNIPLDPIVPEETPRQVFMRVWLVRAQHVFAFSGVVASCVAFIISPNVALALLVVAQFFIFFLFRRLNIPTPPKSWGIVKDAASHTPLARVIVRIFESKYNKLLETQITDAQGRYSFLARNNVYYVTAEAPGYRRERLPDIDLTHKDETVIAENIKLIPEQAAGEHKG
jgi:hypothetical protein